jgi:hypothetical protein
MKFDLILAVDDGDESVHFGGVAALRSRLVDVGQ